jgi:hypothetical protein
MRTSQAARYARWAAAAAILLAAAVVVVYSYRSWQGRKARQAAPPAVPQTVQQRSAEFSFSKVEKERTIFVVRASQATEFREGSRNILEEVRITIYGRQGDRNDQIHTRECEYISASGRVHCAGDVTLDLQSAKDARRREAGGAGQVFHMETRNVTFER